MYLVVGRLLPCGNHVEETRTGAILCEWVFLLFGAQCDTGTTPAQRRHNADTTPKQKKFCRLKKSS